MAKKALINREKNREVVRNKYATKRNEIKAMLKKLLKDAENNRDEIHECYLALARLPRDSSPVRKRNRCALTGRPRGYYRKVGLCRNMFRIYAMQGEIPGLVKSSW